MSEFFRGWRRKAGLVTLAMACVLMMLWFRSYQITDVITTGTSGNSHQFVVTDGGDVVWGRSRSESLIGRPTRWSWSSRAYLRRPFELPKDWQISEQRTILGVAFMTLQRQDITVSSSRVPYWSLVLPLTLLSAWLILIKPPPPKSMKESNRG